MRPVPDRRLRPAENARNAATVFGRDVIIAWCEDLLSGRALDDDPRYPDIIWLGGVVGRPAYWRRVWGARGLLHLGPPERREVVLDALGDESWRVREMALKVITRHALDDPEARAAHLTEDPVDRVRVQALRSLGVPPSDRRGLSDVGGAGD